MASYPIHLRLSKRSAHAERFGLSRAARVLATRFAVLSNAAMGATVAYLELATLQRNVVVPAAMPALSEGRHRVFPDRSVR